MLRDWASGHAQSWAVATASKWLLTEEQEKVLVDWAIHCGEIGLPFSRQDIHGEASRISGKAVGINWARHFEQRHSNLQSTKPAQLNPKHAKNFNKTIINNYFDKLEAVHARFPGGIPPEHIWNMDEKGIQLGGGWGPGVEAARNITSQGLSSKSIICNVIILRM
jgi:Tc5 transposase DNA-binding domain